MKRQDGALLLRAAIMLVCVCSITSIVSGVTITTLSDGSAEKILTFTSAGDQVVFLRIGSHRSILTANLDLSGMYKDFTFSFVTGSSGYVSCMQSGGYADFLIPQDHFPDATAKNIYVSISSTRDQVWEVKLDGQTIGVIDQGCTDPNPCRKSVFSSSVFNLTEGRVSFELLRTTGYNPCQGTSNSLGDFLDGTPVVNGTYYHLLHVQVTMENSSSGYPRDPFLEAGAPDGIYEWNYAGEFDQNDISTDDFSSEMNAYLRTSIPDSNGDHLVPLLIHADSAGMIRISNIAVETQWVQPPVITAITPDSGPQGTYMKIEGSDFGNTANNVLFDSVPGTEILSWEANEIFCRVPEVHGVVSVQVRRDDGQLSSALPFTVTIPVTIHVDLTNTSGLENGTSTYPFSRIQRGIDAAFDGAEVIVQSGTYTGDGNRDIDFLGKAITVHSTDPNDPNVVAATIINCNGTEAEPHRGFYFHSGEDANSVVAGLTITNGFGDGQSSPDRRGGGIRCVGASPRISGNIISRNWADRYGGGIFSEGGSPIITGNTITGNSTYRGGGGIACQGGSPIIIGNVFKANWARCSGGGLNCRQSSPIVTDCLFIDNWITDPWCDDPGGGGMYNNRHSSPIVTNCTFIGNKVNCRERDSRCAHGGGMYNNDDSSPAVTNCTFHNNSANRSGGGMYSQFGGSPTVTNCTFSHNSAGKRGGGMCGRHASSTVTNCTFSDNSAAEHGGGMGSRSRSSPTVTNCTFGGNSAGGYGGGLWSWGSEPVLANCTFAGNWADQGNALTCYSHPVRVEPSNVQVTNCIFWDGGDEIWNADNSTITVTYSDVQGAWPGQGNIDADPCFVEPGYWDPNGTPGDVNDDYWVDGDYHLLAGSSCIDTGDPNYVPEPNETDLDGNPRVVGGRIDMGAYESYWPPIECPMDFRPKAVNLRSRGKWIKAHFVLPAGYTIEDVDTNTPATIVELGLHSEHVRAFGEAGSVKVEAAFDRREFCWAGPFEGLVTVEGLLVSALAAYWLVADCGRPDWCGGSDLNRDSIVDFADFALLNSCCEVIE
jgi:parallel beta-helix repeat protein